MAQPDLSACRFIEELKLEIEGKVILTTGTSPSSLGSAFVKTIAQASPALLILAGRSQTKLEKTAAAISSTHPHVGIRLLELDLGSLTAVRRSAAMVNSWTDVRCIDVLVNNAGIIATDFELSPDGFESQFATNHLGHFLFANLIMRKILAAPTPRILSISSDGHRLSPIRWGDYKFVNGETYNKWLAYGQSKTANILFAVSLAKRFDSRNLVALSLHPGVIMNTNLGTHIDWDVGFGGLSDVDRALGNVEGWGEFQTKSLDEGVATYVHAAFEPALGDENGAYLLDCHVADPWVDMIKPWATDPVEAEKLWKLSEKLVGQVFDY